MTLTNLTKAPFPYFGGKRKAAPAVWQALGDVPHYVEPFAGSLAVLLERPHPANRTYYSETVNDADGLLVNAWRSIQLSPDATAEAASNPVAEADLIARHLALVRWREERQLAHLMGDPRWHDPEMAGWWMWGLSSWIGSGWCTGTGPWTADHSGRIHKQARGTREPGVVSQRPHLGDDGLGVNHASTRDPGVASKRPHLTDNGRGVNRPQTREPGVKSQRPHLGDNGEGVNHAGTREPGIVSQRPQLGDNGRGVNHASTREPGTGGPEYHPVTMPELRRWFAYLSARLRHVRILNGDWTRAVTSGASLTLPVRMGAGPCGVFLDPPYAVDTSGRSPVLYDVVDGHETVAHAVRDWCVKHGDDPRYRIVLAGFDKEHELPDTWRSVEWFTDGYLTGGMGNAGADGHQQKRERLWLSPHCLGAPTADEGLFDL